MQFTIKVVSVEAKEFKNKQGKPYQGAVVAFWDEGKVFSRVFPEFANSDVYASLLGMVPEHSYLVTTSEEKINGYWQWLSVKATNSDSNTAVGSFRSEQTAPSKSSASPVGKVLGSNYETPAERALKQKYIIAQSSLTAALKYVELAEPGGTKRKIPVVLELADEFYGYVMSKGKDFSDLKDDIPQ